MSIKFILFVQQIQRTCRWFPEATSCLLFTARKQNLGQFNVTSVCLSTGGVCMMSLPIWLPGPMFLLEGLSPWSHVRSSGGLCLGGLCLGGLCPGGLCPRGGLCRETPTRNQKSRRYASYWNAFLFTLMLERLRVFFGGGETDL